MPAAWTKDEFNRCLEVIRNQYDSVWVGKLGFQLPIVEIAWNKLSRRGQGWLSHAGVWSNEGGLESKFQNAWEAFEKKHFAAYKRWKKLSGAEGGFSLTEASTLDSSLQNILLYYCVYGEIQDFRAIKNMLHLVYHISYIQFQGKSGTSDIKIGQYIRDEGTKMYRFLSLVYSKEEMNDKCFGHDDLDDLCATSGFCKKVINSPTKDFYEALGVKGSKQFAKLEVVLALDTPTFILRWLKSAQNELNPEARKARDVWIMENFVTEEMKKELETLKAKSDDYAPKIAEALKEKNDKDRDSDTSDRYKPKEADFDGKPDALIVFRSAVSQLNSAKTLLQMSEESEMKTTVNRLKAAQVALFTERKASEIAYKDALNQYENLAQAYADCEMSLRRATENFNNKACQSNCKTFTAESKRLQAESKWKRLCSEEMSSKIKAQMIVHFAYIDTINAERTAYANTYKTFREVSGGPGGASGYFTVWYHFSAVAYLHLFMLAPIAWLYFDYQNQVDTTNFGGSIGNLTKFTADPGQPMPIFDANHSPIIPVGAPLALMLVMILICNLGFRWRTNGPKSGPRRDAGVKALQEWGPRWRSFLMWVLIVISEVALMKVLILNPIKVATQQWLDDFDIYSSIPYILINWLPVIFLYICSVQFLFSCWVAIFGFVMGWIDGVSNVNDWGSLIQAFHPSGETIAGDFGRIPIPKIVYQWDEKVMPKPMAGKEDKKANGENGSGTKEEQEKNADKLKMRKYVAFAKVWNATVTYFYDIHKISQEELQRYTFKVRASEDITEDFLSDRVEKQPELDIPPKVKEVRYHLQKFVNNIRMIKPTIGTQVANMLPLNVITPVGAEKILYPFDFIIHVDNTQSSFLQHLINAEPAEWDNFKTKECLSEKAKDWISRMEKDVLQGLSNTEKKSKKNKRWIDSTEEGQQLRMKVCEWASIRFQALYRTVHGFMQAPIALALLARIQDPTISQETAEDIARSKFSYLVGYQSYANYLKKYKRTKKAGTDGSGLTRDEAEAHEAVFFVKFLRSKFPELRICFPDTVEPNAENKQTKTKYIGRLISGVKQITTNSSTIWDYQTELFGPFVDLGLGKPTHQNFMSQFVDGVVLQTIDINQDSVLPQSFFIPNMLGEFALDDKVKIIGCPEFIVTTSWSSTAWCSAFAERTFGTMTQRCYSRLGVRLHYGHPDFIDALWVQTETGLSKLPYVSEDIFTGFDTVLKGGKIIHREYHEVGKARDVDLYTTTKFQRKISMGAGQMACSRYIDQLTTSWSVSWFQVLTYYYSTVGHYQNHAILWISVWFALVAQLVLIILQKFIFQERIAYFVTERIFTFQVGYLFMVPGVLQLVLEYGLIWGLWIFISNFIINYVYSTFHILNVSSYWQYGLTNSAYYLASGRGTGLEHYFMLDMYDTFYHTHWGPAFVIFWMGFLVLILSGNFLVFAVMYLLPSGIWLWGAMALNPGSLPSSVHEEQWKRLMNADMKQVSLIVKKHTKIESYKYDPIQGNGFTKFFKWIGRRIRYGIRVLHWVYTAINFAIHVRMTRFFAVLVVLWKWVMANVIPTFIFTDERRRLLRWDEDETRTKSIFFSSHYRDTSTDASSGSSGKAQPPLPPTRKTLVRAPSELGEEESSRPLPAPPSGTKPRPKPKRNRSVRFLSKESEGEKVDDSEN